ncbi:hypothetical protein BDV36DRAFT_265446, partial [Aspergillus pseudocaelatus]
MFPSNQCPGRCRSRLGPKWLPNWQGYAGTGWTIWVALRFGWGKAGKCCQLSISDLFKIAQGYQASRYSCKC